MQTIGEDIQMLPVKLTDEEKLSLLTDLGKAQENLHLEESRQQDAKAAMKAQLTSREAKVDRLSAIARSGEEYRDVKVEIYFDSESKEIATFRNDTGEEVSRRPARNDEIQTHLKLDGKETENV